MKDNQYDNLIEEVRGIRKEIAQIDRDLAKDRQDLCDFRIEMAGMKSELKEFRGMIGSNAERVEEKVTDALGPAIRSVDSLKREIKKKKTIIISKSKFIDWIKLKLSQKNE